MFFFNAKLLRFFCKLFYPKSLSCCNGSFRQNFARGQYQIHHILHDILRYNGKETVPYSLKKRWMNEKKSHYFHYWVPSRQKNGWDRSVKVKWSWVLRREANHDLLRAHFKIWRISLGFYCATFCMSFESLPVLIDFERAACFYLRYTI